MNSINVVFVLDTSASMNQRTSGGLTLIDCAKSAVEHFLKVRARDASSKMDTYALVTCSDAATALRAYSKFPFTNFTRALKTVVAKDLSLLGAAVKRSLDLLNLQRLVNGADTYAHGYSTASLDPTVIILLTDGTEEGLQLPIMQSLGSELCKQPFRWDQRVFTVFLKMPSVLTGELGAATGAAAAAPTEVSSSESPVAAMCEVTGGRALCVRSLRALLHAMESLVARLQPCVIVCFEQASAVKSIPLPPLPPPTAAACQHRLLSVRSQGLWPFPEGFNVETLPNTQTLPPREAQPTIGYVPVETEPHVSVGLPVDVYELEACPISGFMMSAHKSGTPDSFCWQVCSPSLRTESGLEPYGFLRLKRQGNLVCLHILPYNYPVLVKLLDQLSHMGSNMKVAPPIPWRQEFERYCTSIPSYYMPPLRVAFKRMGIPVQLIPDLREGLKPATANHLKQLQRQAKMDLETIQSKLLRQYQSAGISDIGNRGSAASESSSVAVDHSAKLGPAASKVVEGEPIFSNPFAIPRSGLVGQLSLLTARITSASKYLFRQQKQQGGGARKNVMETVKARKLEEAKHSVPITVMGDYHEIALQKAPPRDPFTDDEERSRQQRIAFGNPFKNDKRNPGSINILDVDGMVDEAREAVQEAAPGIRGWRRRRAASEPPGGTAAQQEKAKRAGGGALSDSHGKWAPDKGCSLTQSAASGTTTSNSTSSTSSSSSSVASGAAAATKDAAIMAPKAEQVAEVKVQPSSDPDAPPLTAEDGQESETKDAGQETQSVEAFEQQPKVDAAAADAMWTAMLQAKETQQATRKRSGPSLGGMGPATNKQRTALGAVAAPRAADPTSAGTSLSPRTQMPMEALEHGRVELQIMRAFNSHREGVVDMSDKVLHFLNSDEMSPNRFRWAADLVSVARSMRKHTMAATLQRILAE